MFSAFADGVLHDLNNIHGAMTAVADSFERLEPSARISDPAPRECLTDLKAALKRATALTRRLRAFTRTESEGHTTLDLSAICEETARLFRRALDEKVELRAEIEPGLMVTGDAGALHQMLLNLCVNGRDAMPEGGRLTIAVASAAADEVAAHGLDGSRPHVVVSVADTGAGIAEAEQERIFEPSYTTKKDGSGLGLAIVREVVLTHGGKLALESAPDEGTCFRMYLRAAVVPRPSHPGAEPPPRGAVLIVDDDPVLRRGVARSLVGEGFRVSQADSGAAALELLAQDVERPDLLLLDLDLGDMRGEDLLRILSSRTGAPRVVVMSGEASPLREQQLRRAGAHGLLPKPTPTAQLVRALERAARAPHPATICDEPTTDRAVTDLDELGLSGSTKKEP